MEGGGTIVKRLCQLLKAESRQNDLTKSRSGVARSTFRKSSKYMMR